jgi:CheY-like chemotaxis protein
MPSVRQVLEDSLGDGQHLQDSSFQKVMESEDHARSVEAKEKGHTGDAPLRHPQKDTMEIAQGHSKMPKVSTSVLNNTEAPISPAPIGGSSNPLSRTNSDQPVRKVLLVDDNRVNLQLLVTYIKRSGHYFRTASNGLEALETYKSECDSSEPNSDNAISGMQNAPFDYVLMDVSMPIMDGLTSTREIRAHERANNIKPAKVIALTGLASAQAQQEAYSSGVDTFMTKPVKLKELGKMLDAGTLGNEETKEDVQRNEQKDREKEIEKDKDKDKDNGK